MVDKNMIKESLKKILPVMQAFVEGKTIQRYDLKKDDWYDVSPNANIDFCYDYRIKPQSKYRPFQSREECWQEMLKHQPFGWIYNKNENINYCIISVQEDRIELSPIEKSYSKELENDYYLFNVALKEFEYTFADGTPFGIKEECDEK